MFQCVETRPTPHRPGQTHLHRLLFPVRPHVDKAAVRDALGAHNLAGEPRHFNIVGKLRHVDQALVSALITEASGNQAMHVIGGPAGLPRLLQGDAFFIWLRLLRTVARMIGPKCGSRSIWLTARTRRGVTRGPRRSGGGQMLPEELCNGRI
jgi:hypothetical protein